MAIVVPVITNYNAKGINKAIADFKKLDGASAKTGFALRGIDQAATGLVKGLAKAGAAVGAVAGVIGFKLASAAYESQKVMAATEQIIKTTGGAANLTASQIGGLSEKLSEQIGVDDELIQQSANLLLTFKQIQNQAGANNDIFTQSLTLAQDLGHLFGSASGAAMQLGKALSDPTRGMTALRKAGINFTEAQKEQIKVLQESGDLLGAQKIVLEEVRNQVGGLAAATATDFDRAKVAIGNLAETFGFLLLPIVEKVARYVSEQLVPFFEKLAQVIGEQGIGGGIKFLAGEFLGFITNLDGVGAKVYFLIAAFAALKAATVAYSVAVTIATVLQKSFNLAINANLIGLIVAAVVALGVAVVAAYMKFEGFRKVVNTVVNFVIGLFENMVNNWIRAINFVISGINLFGGVLRAVGIDMPKIGKIGEVSFGRIKTSADKATGGVTRLLGQIQSIKNEERQMESAKGFDITGGAGGSGGSKGPVETAKEKLEKYIDALKQVKDRTKSVTEATKSLTDAQKNITKATQAVTEAQANLAQATKEVENAEKQLEKVRKGLGAGSKESMSAAEKIADAQRELEEAGYTLEERTFAVKDAEEELAKLRKDSKTPMREVREAEINLARARIALTEAGISQRNITRELSSAQAEYEEITNGAKEGSDRLKEALDAVDEAKKKQTEASDKLVEAQEKVTEAIDKEKDATDKLRDAKWELFDAEKALLDLRKQIGDKLADKATTLFQTRETIAEAISTIPTTITTPLPERVPTPAFMPAPITAPAPSLEPAPLLPITQEQLDQIGAIGRGDFSGIDLGNQIIRVPSLEELLGGGIGTLMADGGIVTRATSIIAGEAGAEAIIPLDRLEGFGNTYNISVTAGMGADGKDIGTQIVNALKRYERTNGALPLTVA